MKYIYHHLGLGDHIICNGLVRYFKELHGEVTVFSKPHNYENIKHMYRDDENIKVINVGDDGGVNNFIDTEKLNEKVIRVGFGNLTWRDGCTFDEEFYTTIGVPFEYRFSKFNFLRDLEKETLIFNQVNPLNEKYVFTHGELDLTKIRTDLKIISNPSEFGLFDIIKLIENAEEVHLMESSIKCLVNSYVFSKPKFYYHQYVRGYGDYLNSKGLNKFEIVR